MVVSTLGDTVDSNPPKGPLSDVTSIITPTENGELCKLPYRINPYIWDMYFCNEDYCETATNPKSKCASGRFGHVQLFNTNVYSIPLKAGTGGIDGINEQCIIYYYYIPDSVDIQMSITLRKVENDSTTEVIDSVTNSLFNGWAQRKIDFQARQSEYMIYFDFQKTIGILPSFGIDEISIHQADAYVTQSTTNEVSTSTVSIRTTESETSMAITMESSTITADESTTISEETVTSVTSSTNTNTGEITSSSSTMTITQTTSTTTYPVISTMSFTTVITPVSSETTNKTLDTSSTRETTMPIQTSTTARITSTSTSTTTLTTTSNSLDDKGNNNSFKKTLTISLSIAISAVFIISIGIGILVTKRAARRVPDDGSRRLTNIKKRKKNFVELDRIYGANGINGINDQCLIYYYYLPNITVTEQNIQVYKEEAGSSKEIIDTVTSSPCNGWIKQHVNCNIAEPGYKIYFDFEKTSGTGTPTTAIAIDEISIHQRRCSDESVTQSATNPISTSTVSIRTTESETTIANLSNVTTTTADQQSTSNSQTYY
ncbi:unnamed protein product [Rotaria socialis]|uniref:MAM domain-containing protein n=3 Tax=Rotaria socialis TaxID=392032 RepID=A0A821KCE2_9BILA|nr:unnamed protein product [Rotaria socialis]